MRSKQSAPLSSIRTMIFAASALLAWPASSAWADPVLMPVNTCTTLNCGSKVIEARINSQGADANPWVGQFWTEAGDTHCARLEITKHSRNTAMSVISPDGRVYTSDDGGGTCGICPRVVIRPAGLRGVYTVVVNQFAGAAVEATFSLNVSQYNLSNPNCSSPTPALAPKLSVAESEKFRKAKKN